MNSKTIFAATVLCFVGATSVATASARPVCEVQHGVNFYQDQTIRVSNLGITDDILTDKGCAKKAAVKAPVAQTETVSAAKNLDLAKNKEINLDVKFKTGSAQIDNGYESDLSSLLSELKSDSSLKLRIEGHTDATGSQDLNVRLSAQRAAAIKQYLIKNGIEASRLETLGNGAAQPVASNETDEGRAQNRRITVKANR